MKSFSLFWLLLLAAGSVFGHQERYSQRAEGTAMSQVLDVRDGRYANILAGDWSTQFTNLTAEGILTLGINHASANYVAAHNYFYKFNVRYWNAANTVSSVTTYCLRVGYDPTGAVNYQDKQSIRIPGAHRLEVTFAGTFTDASGSCGTLISTTAPLNVYVEADIVVERYYLAFSPTTNWTTGAGNNTAYRLLDSDADTKTDFIDLYWPYIAGAEYYDVEWTFINNYPETGATALLPAALDFTERQFELNSTRISTGDQHYTLPSLFNSGYLIFRVRGVAKGDATATYTDWVKGKWSTDGLFVSNTGKLQDFPVHSLILITPAMVHEPTKNWQHLTTYAEDGKRKDVVSYYDGSMRARQSVTLNNTDQEAIVAETKYDLTGRGVIGILPAPTGEGTLKYRNQWNQATGGSEIRAAVFDVDAPSACSINLLQLATNKGSGQYYSQGNNRADSKYVPDANGYGYSQVEYEPDNTGRIRRQSGVGTDQMLTGTHVSSYFYGKPSQEELDRLFGADVGYDRHYQKNLVTDASGQVSLSYLDAHGRTIVTALAGSASAPFVALKDGNGTAYSELGQSLTEDLLGKLTPAAVNTPLDNNYISSDGMSLEFGTQLLSDNTALNSFQYTANIPDFIDPCAGTFKVNYRADLHLRDACGIDQLHFNSALLDAPLTYPATPGSFSAALNIGNYAVSKKLTLDPDSLDTYVSRYVTKAAGCLLTLQDFKDYQDEFVAVGIDCEVTCETCTASLNAYYAAQPGGIPASGAPGYDLYQQALYDCEMPCKGKNLCETAYEMMLGDVRPFGQYGEMSSGSASDYPLSVYNTANVLPSGMNYTHATLAYKDENGEAALVPNSAGVPVTPNALTVAEFQAAYQPSWAAALIPLHPEYCYYQGCVDLVEKRVHIGSYFIDSDTFDDTLLAIETFARASAGGNVFGNLTNLQNGSAIYFDPYFQPAGPGAGRASEMAAKLANYQSGMSLTDFCAKVTTCGTAYGNPITSCVATYNTNAAWNMYKMLYLSLKQQLMQDQLEDDAVYTGCYSGCFSPIGDDWIQRMLALQNFPTDYLNSDFFQTSPARLCGLPNYQLYKNKTSRFRVSLPSESEALNTGKQADYEYYQATNICPLASDFKSFIESLSLNGLLTTTPVSQHPAFTEELYKQLNAENGTGDSPYHPYVVTPTVVSATTLRLDLLAPGVTNNCPVTLTVPVTGISTLSWSMYDSLWRIEQVSNITLGIGNNSVLTVWIDDDNDVDTEPIAATMNVNSCFKLGACQAELEAWLDTQCEANAVAQSLVPLMNHLSANSKLNLSSFVLSGPVYTALLEEISPLLGGGTLTWKKVSAGYQVVGAAKTLYINATGIPGSNPQFVSIAPVAASNGGTLSYQTVTGPVGVALTLFVNTTAFAVGSCGILESLTCSDAASQNRAALEQLFAGAFARTIPNGAILNAYPFFSNVLQDQLGPGVYTLSNNLGSTPPVISILDGAGKSVCRMQLTLNNWINPPLASVYHFDGFYAQDAPDQLEDGQAYNFTIQGTYNSRVFFATGKSCWPIVNCDNCYTCGPPTENFKGANYATYQSLLTSFGATPLSQQQYEAASSSAECLSDFMAYANAVKTSGTYSATTFTNLNVFCSQPACPSYGTYKTSVTGTEGSTYYLTQAQFDAAPTLWMLSYLQYYPNTTDNPKKNFAAFTATLPVIPACAEPVNGYISMPAVELYDPCAWFSEHLTTYNAQLNYDNYIAAVEADFRERFKKHFQDNSVETFDRTYTFNAYQYTLFYYDQAGNLIQTVPPEGVQPLANNQLAAVATDRINGTRFTLPAHTLRTQYFYNTLNQLVQQTVPDADGPSYFYYDQLGRLVASQNMQQRQTSAYSYMLYDALGRVTEAGELTGASALPAANSASWPTWVSSATARKQVTKTYYDVAATTSGLTAAFGAGGQQELRNRVSYVTYGTTNSAYQSALHYSYDIHGNVQKLVQENTALTSYFRQFVLVEYTYDLISGNVDEVKYQAGKADAFYHRYRYDADNRLLSTWSSTDYLHWDQDAKYYFYAHGPLQRTEIGHNKVQGIDFAYTIQGWLKGVNSNLLKTDRDQGNDGLSATTNLHKFIPADQFGYSLAYFTGDYTAAGGDVSGYVPFEANYTANGAMVAGNLYNGNIKHMVTAIAPLMSTTSATPNKPQAMVYNYDQLNRLSSAKSVNDFNTTTNAWNNTAPSNAFGEQLTYDRNGNIQTLKRYGGTVSDLLMDDFTYTYTSGRNQLLSLKENKLTDLYANDIEGRATAWGYTYDKIGQLLTDEYAQIAEIKWTVNNKVSEVKRAATSNQEDVRFVYDAMGRRIQKTVIPKVASGSNFVLAAASTWKHTFYTYDASGNQLGMYKLVGTQLTLEDQVIYGMSRIGAVTRNVGITNSVYTPSYIHLPGQKTYELANHLGNVLVTVSDARMAINNAGVVARYEAKYVTYSDYYPFGMQMPGRKGGTGYRYGFNGMEKDDEIKLEGNSYTTEFRQYDPRVGRWLSLDPVVDHFSSPYTGMDNNPIIFNDPLGLYTEKRARRIAERAEKLGGEAQVEHNAAGRKGWVVYVSAQYDGKTFKKGYIEGNLSTIDDLTQEVKVPGYASESDYDHYELLANFTYGEAKAWAAEDAAKAEDRAAFIRRNKVNCDVLGKFAFDVFVNGTLIVGTMGTFSSLSLISIEGGTSSYLLTSSMKTGLDAATQAAVNGADNVDFFDAGASGFLTPFGSSALGGAIDYKPMSSGLKVVGYNKSWGEASIDFALKSTFSSQGIVGGQTSQLGNQFKTFDASHLTTLINAPFGLGSKIITRGVKKGLGY